ncbi:MAG: hypothetical protein LH628_04535 [Microcoleus sp. CAN_BIN18]|nr:hypothetical protein [Microcoleus sp. CAN_BIN18]
MLCLVDTNILLRFADRSHPLYPVIRNAVKKLRQDGYKLQVASQNCVEFWNVVTHIPHPNCHMGVEVGSVAAIGGVCSGILSINT